MRNKSIVIKSRKQYVYVILVFSFLLKGAPACDSIDVNIVPVKNGMKRVVVSYYHYSRKEKDRMSSQTDYVWETKNEEMFKYFEARRTKVFYSQIRAMCRFYGKKNVRKYKKL